MNLIKENKKSKTPKYLYVFLLLIICLGCSSMKTRVEKNKKKFYISLHSCFENDNIVIKIKDLEVFNAKSITSNELTGSTNVYINYYEKTSNKEGVLIINNNEDRHKKDVFLDFKKNLVLEVIRNGNSKKYDLDLKKGRRILISGCDGEMKTTSIRYYKKRILID